jgi:transcriptional regulator with XRE-family HTH domain
MLTEQEYQDYVKTRVPAEPHPLCVMLRDLRKAAGLSLARMEHKFGIKAVVVGAYERGDREPPLRKLDQILALYGYRLAAVPVSSDAVRISTDMVADLRAIADQLEAISKTTIDEEAAALTSDEKNAPLVGIGV